MGLTLLDGRMIKDQTRGIVRLSDYETSPGVVGHAGFQAALTAAAGRTLVCLRDQVVVPTGTLTLPGDIVIEGDGVRILPDMTNTPLFVGPAVSSTPYETSSHSQYSRSVVLTEAPAGLAVGDHVMFYMSNPGDPVDREVRQPPQWRRVTGINSATVTLDAALDVAYVIDNETLFMLKVEMTPRFVCRGLDIGLQDYVIDAPELPATERQAVFTVNGYETVLFEDNFLRDAPFVGYTSGVSGVSSSISREVTLRRQREISCDFYGQMITAFWAHKLKVSECERNGDGFGLASTYCDINVFDDNDLRGRYYEIGPNDVSNSIRGIKVSGCLSVVISNNRISGYDSGIKVEDTANTRIVNNQFQGNRAPINQSNQSSLQTSDLIIMGNQITDNPGTVAGVTPANAAIFVTNDKSRNTKIEGNIGARLPADFIRCYADYATVQNNQADEIGQLQASTYYCVNIDSFEGASSADVGVVSGNSVFGKAGQSNIKCVRIAASSGYTAANNYAHGTATVS